MQLTWLSGREQQPLALSTRRLRRVKERRKEDDGSHYYFPRMTHILLQNHISFWLLPEDFLFFPPPHHQHVGVCDIYPGPEGKGKFVSTCCWRTGSWQGFTTKHLLIGNDYVSPATKASKWHETGERMLLIHNGRPLVICDTITHISGRENHRKCLNVRFDPHVRKRRAQLAKLVSLMFSAQRVCSCAAMLPSFWVVWPTSKHATSLIFITE